MNRYFENPFADYGNIVRGERFIGRKNDLQTIANRVIRPSEAGNLAIIGEPRIGKSSLVYKAILEQKDDLIAKKLLPIWINLATYEQSPIFFRSLVTRCVDEMEDLDWLSDSVRQAAVRALEDETSWSEGYGRIQRFFEKVRSQKIRILFILDEFDHARHLFKNDISGFQGLRELSYRPEWRVNFITTSRRTIRDIELQTQAISTFDGIFHKHYLAMFSAEDLQAYFARLTSVGTPDTSTLKKHVEFYCGGHPYLLEMLGYEILEVFRVKQTIDVDEAFQNTIQNFLSQYDRMVDLLHENCNLGKLLQILFGPVIDVKQTDIDEFLKYGFIRPGKEKAYVAFSEHFQAFLGLVEREMDIDLWPIWQKTEIVLRHLVTTEMLEQYGEQWPEKLKQAQSNLKAIFERCQEAQKKEVQSFGSRASQNLIDFTYPHDLFAIIFAEWNIFKTVFGHDKNYWSQHSQLLAKIRNPLAHNRNETLRDYERQIAEGYCREILALVK